MVLSYDLTDTSVLYNYTHTRTHTHTYIHTHTYTHTHTHIHTYIHTHRVCTVRFVKCVYVIANAYLYVPQ